MEKRSRPRSIALSRLLILILVLALGCPGRRQPPAGATAAGPVPEWVTVHHPRLAWPGSTITLHDALGPHAAHPGDVTHISSLQELPDNPWYQAGDRRFRPGNLLLSARNLNLLFIVDRQSGEVVWHHTADLDRQHEARMNGPRLPNPGRILVFNNRLGSFWGDHRSELLEIDPRDGAVRWR